MAQVCDFGKEVKKKLVDIDQNQEWLCQRVREDSGLYVDSAYMSRIIYGIRTPEKIVASICKILDIPRPAG